MNCEVGAGREAAPAETTRCDRHWRDDLANISISGFKNEPKNGVRLAHALGVRTGTLEAIAVPAERDCHAFA